MDKRKTLVRTLYRKLLRESQRIPNDASLVHLNQWIDDRHVEDRKTLAESLRAVFQKSEPEASQDGVQRAMEGLRLIHTLDVKSLPRKRAVKVPHDHPDPSPKLIHSSPSDPQQWVEEVEWLDPISGVKITTDFVDRNDKDDDNNTMEFPVFPLSGPTFPKKGWVPVVSQFSDVPVSGMEIVLKIFEPRYRQMYNDLLTSSASPGLPVSRKSFIVPFSHPYGSGQYASFGWLYEIMQVQDVADETNSKVQLVCNHLVTKPVKILNFINPSVYDTQSTYLRAKAQVLDDDFGDKDSTISSEQALEPLEKLLRDLQQASTSPSSSFTDTEKTLVDRLLMALAEGSLWSVTQVWILNLQMQILELQARIADKIQKQATQVLRQDSRLGVAQQQANTNVTKEMVLLAQEPHKEELESMLMEVSTLVPLLLQDSSHKIRCERLCQRIQEHFRTQKGGANNEHT